MFSRRVFILVAIATLISTMTGPAESHAAPVDAAPPEGFRALFNGVNLDGWWGCGTEDPRAWMALDDDALRQKKKQSQADIAAHWSARDGILVNDGHGLFLTTEEHFEDFELLVEYKTVAGADSGIYLRGVPQVQIWDYTEAGGKWNIGADKGSGGLWNNSAGALGKDPLVLADRPFGEWNRFRIVMVGERVTVYLNDLLVVDHARMENYFDRNRPMPRTGPIQLQTHGGAIDWRNVFIRDIGHEEASKILRNGGPDRDGVDKKFSSIFNGTDFTGWSGPTDNYVVEDGAIRCKPGHGGTIYTDDQYSDFEFRFEFRLPPGGNNGLAIRYPGNGDTAYVGMCELQVLENTHPNFANLDPRQYHGSVYGQAAAERGYLRPPNTWNTQSVTVVGPRIIVELNGWRILDVDTSTIETYMYAEEQFAGRDRTSGHVGFAGHNDPVAFRAIEIRRLTAPGE